MARLQTVYTDEERESTQRGPNGTLELEQGHLWSWHVVVVMWTWQAGCKGWLRRWQCPSQLVVVWWLTSLGHLHFLWPLSLGGKQSSQNNGVILAFYV